MSLLRSGFRKERGRSHQKNGKRHRVQATDNRKQHAIPSPMRQQRTGNKIKNRPPRSPAKTDEPCNRTNRTERENVGRQSHDQTRPGLLPEKCNAEKCQGETDRHMWDQDDRWHQRGTDSQGKLAREIERISAMQETAGKVSA